MMRNLLTPLVACFALQCHAIQPGDSPFYVPYVESTHERQFRDLTIARDTTSPLCWSFFFSSDSQKNFAPIVAALQPKLYRVASTGESATGAKLLKLERLEVHSSESLRLRNEALAALAKTKGVVFEGWNVQSEGDNADSNVKDEKLPRSP